MRFLLVALLAGLCASSAVPRFHNTGDQAQRQKDIFRLFKHINQPSYYPDHQDISKNYRIYEHLDQYHKPEVVQEFQTYFRYGKLLQRGEFFSIFNHEHLKQAIMLFKLFYYADSYETFYTTAVWARNHVNEGMFLYSVSVALVHRPDTYFYSLPPIYEVYPHYFYNSDVIQKAQIYKQVYHNTRHEPVVYANYSGHYLNLHPEQSLSYFTEDPEVNAYYYYASIYYPFWMSGEEFNLKNDKRGEFYYYLYQQILARYYLERLSNGFGEIKEFNWEVPFETGYHSSLVYPNGLQFPSRPNYANLHEYFYNYGQKHGSSKYVHSYTNVQDYERRIRDAIDMGYVQTASGQKVDLFSRDGIDTMGNMIESNPDSPYYRYYGAYQTFARHLLGYAKQPINYHKVHPSALEHFETSLRDPAFYQLYKKLMQFFIRYKTMYYRHYSEQDLAFPGVTVKNVEFERLVTYFDYFYNDISNAAYVTPEEYVQDSFKVQVAQQRLTHKPFTYKVYVNSERATDAVVRIYIGPKHDEYGRDFNMSQNWANFVQFDHFVQKMQPGENVITRSSEQIYNYMHDRASRYQTASRNVKSMYEDDYYKNSQFWFGFPQRFALPKGSEGGVTYQFYVIVSKMVPYQFRKGDQAMVGTGSQYVDGYPMGYPFDRPVYFEDVFYNIPNSYVYEAKVYHKESKQREQYGQHKHEYYEPQNDYNEHHYPQHYHNEHQQHYETEQQQQQHVNDREFVFSKRIFGQHDNPQVITDKFIYGQKHYPQQAFSTKYMYGQQGHPQQGISTKYIYGQQDYPQQIPTKYIYDQQVYPQQSYYGKSSGQETYGQQRQQFKSKMDEDNQAHQISYKQQDLLNFY